MKIYCLYNTVNNKRYIGQTSLDVSMRWAQHRKDAKREKSPETRRKMSEAMKKIRAERFWRSR